MPGGSAGLARPERRLKKPSPHLSRWLVAGALIPLVLGLVFLAPGWLVLLALAGAGAGLALEFCRLLGLGRAGAGLIFLSLALLLAAAMSPQPGFMLLAVALSPWPAVVLQLFGLKAGQRPGWLGGLSLGLLYLNLPLALLALTFLAPGGRLWVFFLLAVNTAADTGAFYTGRTLGRRALAPRLSPKKTWEGFFGGLASAALTGLALSLWLSALNLAWPLGLACGLVLAAWGAAGDLFESQLKRAAGVKDSGGLLPGHGGLLDRFDSLIFNAPLIYLMALLTGALR